MRSHLRAGIAIHNSGEHHAAHDAWEDHWLDLKADLEDPPATAREAADLDAAGEGPDPGDGTTTAADERLLHGLIQFTGAVHHLGGENWAGARGLAEGGRTYLDPLPADYRRVNVDAVRAYLDSVATDPGGVADRPVLELTHQGQAIGLADLDFGETAIAATVFAEEFGYVETTVDQAVEYAREDLAAGDETSPLVSLLFDFVREPDHRGVAFDRITDHVSRRRRRDDDVRGLF